MYKAKSLACFCVYTEWCCLVDSCILICTDFGLTHRGKDCQTFTILFHHPKHHPETCRLSLRTLVGCLFPSSVHDQFVPELQRSKIPETDDPWSFHIVRTPVLFSNFCPWLAQHGTCWVFQTHFNALARLDNPRGHCCDPNLIRIFPESHARCSSKYTNVNNQSF